MLNMSFQERLPTPQLRINTVPSREKRLQHSRGSLTPVLFVTKAWRYHRFFVTEINYVARVVQSNTLREIRDLTLLNSSLKGDGNEKCFLVFSSLLSIRLLYRYLEFFWICTFTSQQGSRTILSRQLLVIKIRILRKGCFSRYQHQ